MSPQQVFWIQTKIRCHDNVPLRIDHLLSPINPAILSKIGLVDFEIICLKVIIKNKKQQQNIWPQCCTAAGWAK